MRAPATYAGIHELREGVHVPERGSRAAVHQEIQRTFDISVRKFEGGGSHEQTRIIHQRDRCMAQATRKFASRQEEVVLRNGKIVQEADAPACHDAVLVRHARARHKAIQCDEAHTQRSQPDELRGSEPTSRSHDRAPNWLVERRANAVSLPNDQSTSEKQRTKFYDNYDLTRPGDWEKLKQSGLLASRGRHPRASTGPIIGCSKTGNSCRIGACDHRARLAGFTIRNTQLAAYGFLIAEWATIAALLCPRRCCGERSGNEQHT